MAAAANKPGAVHYALIIFVMMSVVLGITTYMFSRDASDRTLENLKLVTDNQNLTKLQRDYDDQIQSLKKKIGINLEKVDDQNNPQNPATVISGLTTEMQTNGKEVAGTTVVESLRKLREALDSASSDRDAKAAKILTLEKEILALREQYQATNDKYSAQAKTSERGKLEVIGDREEKIATKSAEISRLRTDVNTSREELAQERESREKERKDLNGKIANLELRIDGLREKIDNLEKLSFETAKGIIRRVEHTTRTVWINVGEEDFVKPRMTFSVYGRDNHGVARGAEDIKGKIEVTRILEKHMSEALIIEEDLYRPIVSEDLIYTPIWSPGVPEKISIVGPVDLDRDGKSDRELLHQILENAGCVIDNEVDDNGDRIPADGKISVQTRFLVLGDVPELDSVAGDEKIRVKRIADQKSDMLKEARINGVRNIKMNDFLAYIGYQSKKRSFVAGDSAGNYNLKAGKTNPDASQDKASSGNVSGLFLKKRQARQDTSDGTTSKLFGGDK